MWSTSRTQGFWGGDVLDILFLLLQITLVSCSRPLKTNLYGPDQWAPLPSGFQLDSANCRHQQEIGAWEEKGTYSIHSLPPWSTRVGLCVLLFKFSSLLWVRLLFLVRTWTDRGRTSSLNSKFAAEAGSSGDSQESGWVERIYGGVLTIIQAQEYLLLFAIYCALSMYQVLWWVFCIHCHI